MEEINTNKGRRPIDMGKIVKVILTHRKAYCYVLPIVMVVTYLLMCCMPRYYMSSVVLAPESSDNTSLGSFSSSLASLGLGSLGKLANNDAISPDLYPDLLSSNDFVVQLFPIKVINKDGSINTNYYDYLNHKQKDAWWNKIKGYIMELIDPTPLTNFKGTEKVDIFSMSKKQQDIAAKIKKNINCEIDQKTYAITISVKDQDPKICATIADSTRQHLQNFIIDYRTNKAKNDYAYYNNLCNKAKKEYEEARRKYASSSDANMDVSLTSVRSKIDDLENDMQLKYNIYSSMNTQKQAALAKIQEKTPAFTTLQSATVPIKPAGPKRMLMSIAMAMLAFIVMSVYFLRKTIC